MATSAKKIERSDLERVAAQLAKIEILPITADDHLTLRATAKFAIRSFVAGKYRVSIGIRQALLRVDHPSFDMENAYQATLPQETWSQSLKNLTTTQAGGSIKARIGAVLGSWFGVSAEGQLEKNARDSAEQNASVPYRLVSAIPTGWQIGTELGDPRVSDQTVPEGLEHCLNGEYLSGRHEEQGDGRKDQGGAFALCVLRPNSIGNDPRIEATLYCSTGSLRIAVAHAEPETSIQQPLKAQNDSKEREESLRKAFVEICLHRANAAQREGAQTDAMLSGELYLSHQERHAPKLAPKVTLDVGAKPKG